MVKEITQIVKNGRYIYALAKQEVEGYLIPMLKVTEPDVFVDDNLEEELRLTKEIVKACEASGSAQISYRRTPLNNKFISEHFNYILAEAELLARATLFKNAKGAAPNYIMVSSDFLPIFEFSLDFKANRCAQVSGTYVAGTYKNRPVLVSPFLDRGQMIWGINEPNSSAIYTFVNDEGKVCNKIVNPNYLVMIKLED